MKISRQPLVAFVFLSACAAPLYFDKPGVPPGGGQNDLTDCQVEALSKVPPNNQIRTDPGIPATTTIDCIGSYCTADTIGGQSTTYTVDANASLRQRVMIQCMERKGYTLRK